MVYTSIDYTCGCGFRTKELEKATQHSSEKSHTLDVRGIIRPPAREKKEAMVAKVRAPHLQLKPYIYDFNTLREKLKGG